MLVKHALVKHVLVKNVLVKHVLVKVRQFMMEGSGTKHFFKVYILPCFTLVKCVQRYVSVCKVFYQVQKCEKICCLSIGMWDVQSSTKS